VRRPTEPFRVSSSAKGRQPGPLPACLLLPRLQNSRAQPDLAFEHNLEVKGTTAQTSDQGDKGTVSDGLLTLYLWFLKSADKSVTVGT